MKKHNSTPSISLDSQNEDTKTCPEAKAKINLNSSNDFYGRISHETILQRLVSEIKTVNLADVINLPKGEDLRQKHILVAVIKHIIDTAKNNDWNICQGFDSSIYVYNGAFWKKTSRDEIKNFLRNSAVKMGLPEYEARHFEFTDRLLKQFLSDAYFTKPEPDKDLILINLNNGTFEFTKHGLTRKDFSSEDFLTYQLNFDFEPTAKCPLFENFLLKVLPDESARMVLQEYVGYIFSGLNLEKCLILTGEGGNGKSVFMNILCSLIGKESTLNFSLGLFKHEYNRAKLSNILLNYSGEKGFDLNPDIFKALISCEPIQAREPYQKPFTLYNKTKFIFNCNKLPSETENTHAYYRRFIILPFIVKITEAERDIHLSEKIIQTERSGILNWLLIGLDRILKQEKFTFCESAAEVLNNFRTQSDIYELFLEKFGYEKSSERLVSLNELFDQFKTYCEEDQYGKIGKNIFSKELEGKGFKKVRKNSGYYFYI